MKHRHPATNPVERAVLMQKWHAMTTAAHIHALIGGDTRELLAGAGSVIYVTLGAAQAQGVDMEQADIRIIAGAANALADQSRLADIDPTHRAGIASGLAACQRIASALSQRHVLDAVVQMHFALRTGRAPWIPAQPEGATS